MASAKGGMSARVQSIIFAVLVIAGLGYLGYYLYGVLNPDIDTIATKKKEELDLQVLEQEQETIKELNETNSYYIDATVVPGEEGRTNPFAPAGSGGSGLSTSSDEQESNTTTSPTPENAESGTISFPRVE